MKIPFIFLAFFLVSGFLPAAAAPETSDRLRISEVNGPKEVKVVRAVGAREEYAGAGTLLFVGDEIITASGQIVGVESYDGSKWKIAPNTKLKLEARKPEKESYSFWVLNVFAGALWGEVPKSTDGKNGMRLKIHTKNAAMGIRGTEYLLEGDDKHSAIDVLEGTVWWGKSIDFAPGTYREVSAGEHAEMTADGKISVSKSEGDKGALAVRYGVAVPGPISEGDAKPVPKKSQSTGDCWAKGKGWKDPDGSKLGDCDPEENAKEKK
ncbi:MAG TPA: FecR family protein [Bdellovibrionota bacterium]|jgi:hypothetical protein